MDLCTPTSLDPGMWIQVPPGWTPEVGTFEMRGHMTFRFVHPNFLGPGYVDLGTPWVDPQVGGSQAGLRHTPEVTPSDME